MEDYSADLKNLDNEHQPEKVPEFGEHVPDGSYHGRLDSIYVGRSQKGKLQTVIIEEIVGGEFEFRKERKYCGMETAENLDYLTKDLRNLGAPKNFKWSELETIFPMLLDSVNELTIKTKNGFTNMYIGRKVESVFGGKSDEDAPF